VAFFKAMLGVDYADLRTTIAASVWEPVGMVEELQGMVDALAVSYPSGNIDLIDLKILNSFSDWGWGWACASHACWGSKVSPGVEMLSSRLLAMGTPYPALNHHVICAWEPSDGSPWWVNAAWAGNVTVVTAVNEYGTQVSLHDYSEEGTYLPNPMPRSVATRFWAPCPSACSLTWACEIPRPGSAGCPAGST
jgi:hypothetical protein